MEYLQVKRSNKEANPLSGSFRLDVHEIVIVSWFVRNLPALGAQLMLLGVIGENEGENDGVSLA